MKTARAKDRAGVSARAREIRNVSDGSGEKSARASGKSVGPPERACERCAHAVKPGIKAALYHVEAQDGSKPVKTPRPTHLFLGTQGDNIRDAARKGRLIPPRGERNGQAKLTVADVRMIYADATRGMRKGLIAARYGISPALVSMVLRGQRWGHVRKGVHTA